MKNNAQLLMPREKMLKFGISALTDVELLALFLRTGTRGKDVLTLAKEMLENFGSLYGLLVMLPLASISLPIWVKTSLRSTKEIPLRTNRLVIYRPYSAQP